MSNEIQKSVKEALRFAAVKHLHQNENGSDLPYLVHLESVATEVFLAYQQEPKFDLEFALKLAYLHDTLEDTEASEEEILARFGPDISTGVQALTKSKAISNKHERLIDSLARIKQQPVEVWIVKLADRTANLDAPNLPWPEEKRKHYMEGSNFILEHLKDAHLYLAQRLRIKIREYVEYVVTGQ